MIDEDKSTRWSFGEIVLFSRSNLATLQYVTPASILLPSLFYKSTLVKVGVHVFLA